MNPREYIYYVLKRVIQEEGYASLIMRNEKSFSKEDQGLISEIVYGVLRNYDYLTYQWKDFVDKRVKTNNTILLNMGVYQLFYLDRVPNYAAINETVELANKHDRGFINAILHKVDERGKREVIEKDEIKKLAIETSHPKWVLRMWESHYGKEKMEKLVRFNNTKPVIYGRINTLKITKEELLKDEKVSMIDEYGFQYDGNIIETEWFKEGKVLIQDYSSQQVVQKMHIKPGMNVMDCCAAPGTKAQFIGMLLKNEGTLYASDIYENRVQLLEKLMKDTGVSNCKSFVRDACIYDESLPKMDAILLDVPCSGLGDLRHKPEIKRHIVPEAIDTLVNIQERILDVNSSYCKKDGILVYSTCTLNKKENEYQIKRFLNKHPEFELEEEKTIFPMEYNSDGFYIARLRRIV